MTLIRPKVVCVFRRDDEILVILGRDRPKGQRFFIPPGGGIEFRESSLDAAHREIREELGLELVEPNLLGVFENVFEYEGRPEHEIVFVYEARFADSSRYEQTHFEGVESNGKAYVAEWVSLDRFESPENFLFPDGLFALLRQGPSRRASE